MRNRSLGALLLLGAVIPFTSCAVDPALTSIAITPSTVTALLGPCGTQQVISNFTAMGTYTRPNHAPVTRDVTNTVTWFSYNTQLVTVSSSGVSSVVTCATPGSTFTSSVLISASAQGFHGVIVGYATENLQEPPPTTTTAIKTLSISRISSPGSALNGVAQFVAVGKTADGTLVPLSGNAVWSSSNPQAVRVDAATGVVRSMTVGKATVTATYTTPDGSTAIGTVDFGIAPQN